VFVTAEESVVMERNGTKGTFGRFVQEREKSVFSDPVSCK
jgi:hypothetical protein